jgi:hypothetical protein
MRLLGRTKHRWDYNVKIYFKEMDYEVVDSFHLSEDRDTWQAFVFTVVNL